MCRKDIIEIVIFDQFLKPEVSQLVGCHLDWKIVYIGERFRMDNRFVYSNSTIMKRPAKDLTLRGVFLFMKVKITMSKRNFVYELLEQPRHHSAVSYATIRQKHLSVAQILAVIRKMFLQPV